MVAAQHTKDPPGRRLAAPPGFLCRPWLKRPRRPWVRRRFGAAARLTRHRFRLRTTRCCSGLARLALVNGHLEHHANLDAALLVLAREFAPASNYVAARGRL